MKKLIRRIDILFAFILTIIYSAVAVGTYSLPNQISQNSDNKIVFNKIYTVNTNNEKSVDYQNASPVSTTNAQINLFGVIPVKNTEIVKVISNKPDAYALTRAKNRGIEAECVSPKAFEKREDFNVAFLKAVEFFVHHVEQPCIFHRFSAIVCGETCGKCGKLLLRNGVGFYKSVLCKLLLSFQSGKQVR